MPLPTSLYTTEAQRALALARSAAAEGRLSITLHARDRMRDRRASVNDVKRAIASARDAVMKENGTWRLTGGEDLDGEKLEVVIDIRDPPVRVVTIF